MADSARLHIRQREEGTDKWSKIFQNSEQITEEPLKRYRLITIKEDLKEDGLVRRYTFGKKDPRKRNKTILMLGETGTGKSTLINRMLNYMLGVKWEDGVRFEIVRDEDKRPQTESQTVAITAYEIFGLKEISVPFSLTIIDTPGYGDSRGLEQDKCNAENLYVLVKSVSGVQQIDAVCLVVKAFQSHLSLSQEYIFDAVLSLFGKNMESSIVALFTHSDWAEPRALDTVIAAGVPCAKDEKNTPVHFLFNNLPVKRPDRKYESTYKKSWRKGIENMREFFQVLDRMETKSLKMTEEVLKERLSLEASVQSLVDQDGKGEAETTTVKINGKATRCTKCKVNCHYPGCWWASSEKLYMCSVMSNEKCTVCPGKCSYLDHVKDDCIYETTGGTSEHQKNDDEAKKTELMDRSYQCVVKLSEFALKFKTSATCKHIECLIDMFKKIEDTEKVQMLENMLKRRGDNTEPPHEDL